MDHVLLAKPTLPPPSPAPWLFPAWAASWLDSKVEKTAQSHGFPATRVAFNPHDHGFITTSGAMHLRLWYSSSDNILKAHGILPQAKEQASMHVGCVRCAYGVRAVYYTRCSCVVLVAGEPFTPRTHHDLPIDHLQVDHELPLGYICAGSV